MPFTCLCLALWLGLKMGSENMVVVRLLQIGAKDLIVFTTLTSNALTCRPDCRCS